MTIKIAGLVSESVVDGIGIRFTVFVQGCPHKCFNCHNPQTHDTDGGEEISISELLSHVKSNPLLDGVTLSGGEPFLYATELGAFAKEVKAMGLNVWCYTGFNYEELLEKKDSDINFLLSQIDVLVDGRFIDEQKDLMLRFRGSKNQRLIDLKSMRQVNKSSVTELEL